MATKDLGEITYWARKIAAELDRGFNLFEATELDGTPEYVRIDVEDTNSLAGRRAFSFSVRRNGTGEELQAEVRRELRKRLCQVCDANAWVSHVPNHDVIAVECPACGEGQRPDRHGVPQRPVHGKRRGHRQTRRARRLPPDDRRPGSDHGRELAGALRGIQAGIILNATGV